MSTSFKNLSVRGPRLKIKLLDTETKLGMFIKPDSMVQADRSACSEAIVIEVSPQAFQVFGCDEEKGRPWCKVGDHILTTKYASYKQADCMVDEDMNYRVINDEDVIGVFNND